MPLHPVVDAVARTYLHQLDTSAPGLVEAVYLVGSVALDDFHYAGRLVRQGPSGAASSDIDFVAVTRRPVGSADGDALARVHRQVRAEHRRPIFDGLYLTWADLGRDPSQLDRYAQTHEGRLQVGAHPPPSPVTWHELARSGVVLRGPDPAQRRIWTDEHTVVAWCRGNLADYWARLPARCRDRTSRWSIVSLTGWLTAWTVLGVARSHYTITTGGLTSKTGAGQYARATLGPRWHRILDEGLRIRAGDSHRPRYANPLARRRDVLAFTEFVLDRHGAM